MPTLRLSYDTEMATSSLYYLGANIMSPGLLEFLYQFKRAFQTVCLIPSFRLSVDSCHLAKLLAQWRASHKSRELPQGYFMDPSSLMLKVTFIVHLDLYTSEFSEILTI